MRLHYILQDENIALMERIEGGELFNVLEGLTTMTVSSVESQKNASSINEKVNDRLRF
jgi:hypothetical protein